MTSYKQLKKEIVLQISRFVPVSIKSGPCSGMWLYGNLFYNRRNERFTDEEHLYNSLSLQDKVIIEAGAHIGCHTMLLASRVGNGKVLAFEPNPLNYFFLCKNVRSNSLTSVVPVNVGLSNQVATLKFVSDRYNRGKGTFKADKQSLMRVQGKPTVELRVPVTTIDIAMEDYHLKSIDFVKVDTEGFEPNVIQGMAKTLQRFKPVISFEIHGLSAEQRQHDLRTIHGVLHKYEYRAYKLTKGFPEVTTDNISELVDGGYIAYSLLTEDLKGVRDHWEG